MKTNETIPPVILASPDSIFSLAASLASRMNSLKLPQARVNEIKDGDVVFWSKLDSALMPDQTEVTREYGAILRDWSKFYKKFFGITADFSTIRIPAKVQGLDRLIVIAQGVSINQVYETGKKNFTSWKWCNGDIESKMRPEERGSVKAAYAIWVRDSQEADEDLQNLSAEMVERPQDTENLLERLVHGFKYWSETKQHLDVRTVTLCASSRYADGFVPKVNRNNDGDVNINRYDPSNRNPNLRARREVSRIKRSHGLNHRFFSGSP